MTMRIHEREQLTQKAGFLLTDHLIEWMETPEARELTSAEYTMVLIDKLSQHIQGHLKYEIRYERHGNRDTPGGFAHEEFDAEEARSALEQLGTLRGREPEDEYHDDDVAFIHDGYDALSSALSEVELLRQKIEKLEKEPE